MRRQIKGHGPQSSRVSQTPTAYIRRHICAITKSLVAHFYAQMTRTNFGFRRNHVTKSMNTERRAMRVSIGILLYLVVGLQSVTAETLKALNVAGCKLSSDGQACYITWDFTSDPRSYYWLQRYDEAAGRWIDFEAASVDPYGISKSVVPGGYLYRILGCTDLHGRDCTSSTVYWPPIKYESASDIPETMVDPSGGTFTVSNNAGLETQLLQYNVYRIAQLIGTIGDLSSFPAMTPPPSAENPGSLTYADVVHINIYPNYESVRAMHIAARARSDQVVN